MVLECVLILKNEDKDFLEDEEKDLLANTVPVRKDRQTSKANLALTWLMEPSICLRERGIGRDLGRKEMQFILLRAMKRKLVKNGAK